MLSGLTTKIIAYEDGTMSDAEVVDFFQELLTTGTVWELQGHYQRMAFFLIEEGRIFKDV
jgi:hypothetical protein